MSVKRTLGSPLREICTMGSERGDEYKRLRSLGEGTGSKGSEYSEAPQRATTSRLVPTHQADFQPGSFGYRLKRSAQQAVIRVADAIAMGKTHVIDLDLKAYFDGVRHDVLLAKVARRISDDEVLHLLKIILKANGKRGVPQGGVISPLTQKITSSSSGGFRGGASFRWLI